MAPSVVISPSAGGNAPVSAPCPMQFSIWFSSWRFPIAGNDSKPDQLIPISIFLHLVLLKLCLGTSRHQDQAGKTRRSTD